ncbi:MAG TPA: MerR family transcriptional regulator, partial [Flavobacterium sp.]|nr:MerR family transcriptional regulator [Flavobacterium sp.]
NNCDCLVDMNKYFNNIIYISYLTVEPTKDSLNNYIQEITTKIIDANAQVWLLGRMVQFIDTHNISNKISVYHSISDLIQEL